MSSDYEDVVVRYGSSESPKACFRPVSCDKDFGHELDLFLFFTCLERFLDFVDTRMEYLFHSRCSHFWPGAEAKLGRNCLTSTLAVLDFGC